MKKIFLLFVFTLIFNGLTFGQATISLPDITTQPNADISIPIDVTGFNNVSAISIVINYDPNVLTFQSNPDPLTGNYFINNPTGQIRIGWFSITPSNFADGALLHLNFKYIGGNTNLDFETTNTNEIADAMGASISTTYKNGSVSLSIITPTGSIGDYVWDDLDKDGIQQDKTIEPPLSGVTVNLLDSSNNVLESTTTDAQGLYSFINLSAGTYKVKFELLNGYVFSPKKVDFPTSQNGDSDADPTTGLTDEITLTENQNIYNVDAGMYKPTTPTPTGSIGDYVWD
ncbi:MAG: carboxypeptidase regulatory-like domain-containing protein, partial [Bacteroidetes bacterium]|nr:carboxypeptidase regulatory-like domain-containing protein [Bacteroidota bacterium]